MEITTEEFAMAAQRVKVFQTSAQHGAICVPTLGSRSVGSLISSLLLEQSLFCLSFSSEEIHALEFGLQ